MPESTRGRAYNPLLKSYPDSVKVNACGLLAEVVYLRLLARADDTGRYWASPRRLLGKLLTHRWEQGEVDEDGIARALDELEGVGLLQRYEAGGVPYLALVDVYRALRKDRPAQVEFPAPPWLVSDTTTNGQPADTRATVPTAATAAAATQPNQATDQAATRARARDAAVDNSFGEVVAAAAAAQAPTTPESAAALAKAERFLGDGRRSPKQFAALRNWVFFKGSAAETAMERLITWARTQKTPQAAFMAALTGGYADEHAQ